MNKETLTAIKRKLLEFSESIPTEILLPTVLPEAGLLVSTDPFAFSVAVCLDRGTKAEIIWTIPYYIRNELGHLNPHYIYKMSLDDLGDLFKRLPQRPRYINAAPRTILELTQIVVEECGGDAFKLWEGKSAMEVKRTFMSIHGVGSGIANMGILLIEKTFGVRFNDLDRSRMDIKPDVHTVRVLFRLGVSDSKATESAIIAARNLNPEFPGAVDGALWEIGRRFCFASSPSCENCPMKQNCAQRI